MYSCVDICIVNIFEICYSIYNKGAESQMALIVIILLIYMFYDYKRVENVKKESYTNAQNNSERQKYWHEKVSNRKLEDEIMNKLLTAKDKCNSELHQELMSVYEELGITNRAFDSYHNYLDEIRLVLMANRGYLPYEVSESFFGYRSRNNCNSKFIENAEIIIPWANKQLNKRGIFENVYACSFSYGHEYYLFKSQAYNEKKNEGVKFTSYYWGPQVENRPMNKIHF